MSREMWFWRVNDAILHEGPTTRSMARRLRKGLSTFIQKAMWEESMKTEEPTMRILFKNEGQTRVQGTARQKENPVRRLALENRLTWRKCGGF